MSERPAKLGRPPLYTQEQVRASIAEVLQKGLVPTVEAVKEVLCLRFGVPRTIRTEPLAREIAALLEADERQREEDLLACLAPETVNAVHEKCSALERTALLAIAEEWTRLAEKDRQRQSSAAQEYADLEEDLKERDAQRRSKPRWRPRRPAGMPSRRSAVAWPGTSPSCVRLETPGARSWMNLRVCWGSTWATRGPTPPPAVDPAALPHAVDQSDEPSWTNAP
jgi:hypothetical protein